MAENPTYSKKNRTPWEGLGFYDALNTIGGRQGVGTHIKLQNYIFDLMARTAGGAFGALPGKISALYEQPRQDVLDTFGGQFQDTADRQGALQSQLDQQFGSSGLGSLRGTQTAALEQQSQRQNLGTRNALSRQLAGVGLAKAGAVGQAEGMLPQFLASIIGQGVNQAGQGTLHAVARQARQAEKGNAIGGALGSLGGAALGSFGGPAGALAGSQIGGSLFGGGGGGGFDLASLFAMLQRQGGGGGFGPGGNQTQDQFYGYT